MKRTPHHQAQRLAFHHPWDHESCVPPERGSHTQGNHASEYVRHRGLSQQGEAAKNRHMDRKPAGSGY